MIAWVLCLAVLVAAVASEDPNLSANGDDFIMFAPGTLYLNGKNVGAYLEKIDELVQENKDLRACGVFSLTYGFLMLDRLKTQCCGT
jgi:hypothetical protein